MHELRSLCEYVPGWSDSVGEFQKDQQRLVHLLHEMRRYLSQQCPESQFSHGKSCIQENEICLCREQAKRTIHLIRIICTVKCPENSLLPADFEGIFLFIFLTVCLFIQMSSLSYALVLRYYF